MTGRYARFWRARRAQYGWWAFLLRLMICDVKAHPSGSHNQSPYCQRTFVFSDSAKEDVPLFVKTGHPCFFWKKEFHFPGGFRAVSSKNFCLVRHYKWRGASVCENWTPQILLEKWLSFLRRVPCSVFKELLPCPALQRWGCPCVWKLDTLKE